MTAFILMFLYLMYVHEVGRHVETPQYNVVGKTPPENRVGQDDAFFVLCILKRNNAHVFYFTVLY